MRASKQVTPEVVTAMIRALDYAWEQKNRSFAGLDYDTRPGLLGEDGLAMTVARSTADLMTWYPELRDTRAIPALLKTSVNVAVGSGIMSFGPRAVMPHALSCASTMETLENHRVGCIRTLVAIVMVWRESIDSITLARIRNVAVEHLKQPAGFPLLVVARLALALGWDAELKELAQQRSQEVTSDWERETLQGYLDGKEPPPPLGSRAACALCRHGLLIIRNAETP